MSDLSQLLQLLHDAEHPFASLRARFRVWRHRERAHDAFVAAASRRRGATMVSAARGEGPPPDPESVEVVGIWRVQPDSARVEYAGGDRDGSFGVRVGELWWSFDPRLGATANAEDESVGSGVGAEFGALLDPPRLLGALRFAPRARASRAEREVIVADAWPRPESGHGMPHRFALHELGSGADRYRLEIDGERGIVLAAHAFAADQPFQTIEALEIALDADLDKDRFVFRPPAGEEIRPAGRHDREVLAHASIPEAQAAAPFTLLVPERVPATWNVHCTYTGPSERPPSPPSVSLHYRSDSGHEAVSVVLRPSGAGRDLDRLPRLGPGRRRPLHRPGAGAGGARPAVAADPRPCGNERADAVRHALPRAARRARRDADPGPGGERPVTGAAPRPALSRRAEPAEPRRSVHAPPLAGAAGHGTPRGAPARGGRR